MRGTRRIVLREPQPTGESGAFGQQQFGDPVNHVVYAVREPMTGGGNEGLIGREVLGVDVGRVYKFPEDALPKTRPNSEGGVDRIVLDETWTVMDENGTELAIDAVGEVNSGPRRRWLRIVCDRKTPEGRVEA